MTESFDRDVDHAASGGFFATQTPSDRKGFARDRPGDGESHLLAVGVHEPGHDLLVRADVRGGNIFVRADQRKDFSRISSGETFQFGER